MSLENERNLGKNQERQDTVDYYIRSIETCCPCPPNRIVSYLNRQRNRIVSQEDWKSETPSQIEGGSLVNSYLGSEFSQFIKLIGEEHSIYPMVTVPIGMIEPGQIGVLTLPSVFTVSPETNQRQTIRTVDKLREIIFSNGLYIEIGGIKWLDPEKTRLAKLLLKLETTAVNDPAFLELMGKYCPEEIEKYAWRPNQVVVYFFGLMKDGRMSVYDSSGVSPSLSIGPNKHFLTTANLSSVRPLPSSRFWVNLPSEQFATNKLSPPLLDFLRKGQIDIFQPNSPLDKSLAKFLGR